MKTLQLNYDKKYLLVEPSKVCYHTISDSAVFFQDAETHKSEHIEGKFKFVCMGNEFEKDVKEGCLLGKIFAAIGQGAFVEEIEKAGYHWGTWNGVNQTFDEIEAKTFNPQNTFIFEKITS